MATKKGLGKGIFALFSDMEEEESAILTQEDKEIVETPVPVKSESTADGITQVSVYMIDPNPDQPRKTFEEGPLKELSESIKIHGVIQPLVVTPTQGNRYMIIAGERRFRAARQAGLETLPVIVRDYNPRQIKEIALIENLQREDLNPIEAALAIKQLMDHYDCTQETVATRIGKSRSAVTNILRLLSLAPPVVELVRQGKLSSGHARTLVVVDDVDTQVKFANQAADGKLTVRDLEKLVRKYLNPEKYAKNKTETQSVELRGLINDMQHVLATKVRAIGNDTKGRIYIDYYTRDDLDRLREYMDILAKNSDR
ncbi:MAG: ParB/RepB/Spo0J family partition protein [Clostridia bacterium]|nr:ParB/RepB/Spo0J family partition protein [Clostridia bacterium]